MKGLRKNIIYSLKPCLLGLCGPKDKESQKILIDFAAGKKVDDKKIEDFCKQFKSAFIYLKFIAKHNGIEDPFDEKVIEAYWLGNSLLKKISPKKLSELSTEIFKQPPVKLPATANAQHSFHVLFDGSLGDIAPVQKLIPFCVINLGYVEKINLKCFVIRTKPLTFRGGKFFLDSDTVKTIECGPLVASNVKKGDAISYHWNSACEILNKQRAKNLLRYLKRNIDAYNSAR
jgi:hypothetical protein